MAGKKTPSSPKKKKMDRRTLWVRVMAIVLAGLMVFSVITIIFSTIL